MAGHFDQRATSSLATSWCLAEGAEGTEGRFRILPASRGALPAGTKSGNYLVNLMALAHAKKRGSYEAVLVDADGRVLEGTTCNVFIVKNGTVRTPPLGAGILAGITRDAVISLCRRGGIPIEETDLTPADMKGADEAFLTSTLRDVMPITKVEEITVGNGMTGPLTETIRRAYQDYVRDELAKGPRACGRG